MLDLSDLKSELNPRAQLILPSHSSYETAKNVWNGLHDANRPMAVVQVAGTADVRACIRYVKQSNLVDEI
jgi:FixJ family two-component response regulator